MVRKTPKSPQKPNEDVLRPDWAKRLEAARTLTGLNATEFARSIKMSQQRYNNYEKGVREPDIQAWIDITRRLNVSVSRIFYGAEVLSDESTDRPAHQPRASRR